MSQSTAQENKRAVTRLFEDGFNRQDFAAIDALVDSEYADPAGGRGPAAFRQVIERLHHSFPDIRYTIEDTLAEGEVVAIRWHWSGTHRAAYRGVPPSGRSLTNTGAAIFRLRAGKVVAAALETDRLGFLQSIGVVPATDALFQARA